MAEKNQEPQDQQRTLEPLEAASATAARVAPASKTPRFSMVNASGVHRLAEAAAELKSLSVAPPPRNSNSNSSAAPAAGGSGGGPIGPATPASTVSSLHTSPPHTPAAAAAAAAGAAAAASPSSGGNSTSGTPGRTPASKRVTLKVLEARYHLPLIAVSRELHVSVTMLKKLARGLGITRWPYRQIRSVDKALAMVREMQENPNISAADRKEFARKEENLASKRAIIIKTTSCRVDARTRRSIFVADGKIDEELLMGNLAGGSEEDDDEMSDDGTASLKMRPSSPRPPLKDSPHRHRDGSASSSKLKGFRRKKPSPLITTPQKRRLDLGSRSDESDYDAVDEEDEEEVRSARTDSNGSEGRHHYRPYRGGESYRRRPRGISDLDEDEHEGARAILAMRSPALRRRNSTSSSSSLGTSPLSPEASEDKNEEPSLSSSSMPKIKGKAGSEESDKQAAYAQQAAAVAGSYNNDVAQAWRTSAYYYHHLPPPPPHMMYALGMIPPALHTHPAYASWAGFEASGKHHHNPSIASGVPHGVGESDPRFS